MKPRSPAGARRGLLAVAATMALLLTGCGGDATGGGAADVGVPLGATKEQYQEAFRNVEPIILRAQADGPADSPATLGRKAWLDAVEEWSGGKITVEWGYSNAFVPSSTEWAAAMADGRIDISNFLPYYTPEVFPALTDLSNATFLDGNAPTATLTSSGWITEVLHSQPQYQQEAEDNGVHVLALMPTANVSGIFCTEPRTSLADFEGVSVSASGQGRVKQLTDLGMAPQSIAFTELYEALQRGVVGCGSTVVSAIDSIGATGLVPHAAVDPDASLVGFPAFAAIGSETWESMPLVARQLLHDRLDILLEQDARYQMSRNVEWVKQAEAAGGGMRPLADDARTRLLQSNDALLQELADRGVDTRGLVATHDRWSERITGELFPDLATDLSAFLTAGGFDNVDLQPFVDAVVSEALAGNRPA